MNKIISKQLMQSKVGGNSKVTKAFFTILLKPFKFNLVVMVYLFYLPNFSQAEIPAINFLLVNDSNYILQDSLNGLLGKFDTLTLGQIDKLEVHFKPESMKAEGAINFKLIPKDRNCSKTVYPYIRYTYLPAGDYQLDCWQGQDTLHLNFTSIAPNEAMTDIWWFQPLLTLCLMLIPFTIVYFLSLDRSRRNLRVEVVRNQIASDLHDDVGVNLSAIKNLTEVFILKNKAYLNGSKSKIISRIKNYTDETLHKLQDTVWAINPNHDSIEELLDKMKDFATMLIPAKGIELEFTNEYQTKFDQKLDMPQRHSMFLMFKEAVNNIVKHANAKKVNIKISNTKKTIIISIKDDGDGFNTETKFAGNGLKNFQSRAAENYIDFDLASKLGKGTAIEMTVFSLQ